MTHAHTPGPWELDSAAWPLIVNGPMNDDDENGTVVCTVECLESANNGYHYNEDEAAANARLISITPDMAEYILLIARMKTNEEMDGDMSGDDAVDSLSLLIDEARSLRKKMEGLPT